MSARVTVLGLGPMGGALAGAFLAAGHRTTVWNRTPGRADALAGRGAVVAPSAAAALAASPVGVLALASYDAVREVLAPVAAGLAGCTLVNLTSGSPPDARETAAWAEARGAAYLDGVVMTTPSGVGDPDFLQLYGGSRAVFETHRATLAALGSPVHLGPDPALSSVYDTALLGLLWSSLTGWLHGVALTGCEGPGGSVPATAFTEVAGRYLKAVGLFMSAYAPQIDAGRYPAAGFPLDLHLMTMDILVHASELGSVSTGLPRLLRELASRAVAAGHGGDSYARLIEYVRGGGAGGGAAG
ncbi:NAD(P)-dependent oxidoreductase [Streptomyces gamaensis]|uniref:NAD(P)-dependent oxidoreductase n=1 Tax=Streptomyces gamaensis TaxID=1763542 RepID=A0ABW0Z1C3_9ACTN